ncbi:hypothetical protein SFRURICE_016938 [Spodoptera frugiperda]|nr:hypothetical protein SFRURICE_016938 [Spodoptera frugiperda]
MSRHTNHQAFHNTIVQYYWAFFRVFENFTVVARSLKLCSVYDNRLTPYYMKLITQMRNVHLCRNVQIDDVTLLFFCGISFICLLVANVPVDP